MFKGIRDIEKNDTPEVFPLYLVSIEKDISSKNTKYIKIEAIDLSLREPTQVSFFKVDADKYMENFHPGDIVDAQIKMKDGRYYNGEWMQPCSDLTLTKENFKRKAPIDTTAAFNEICEIVRNSITIRDEIGRSRYADITLYLLDEYAGKYIDCSAAMSKHHNYIGGLIHHTLGMIRRAQFECTMSPELDKELLICGTALHDIGKIMEYVTDEMGTTSRTVQGQLLGHPFYGAALIRDAAAECGFNETDEPPLLLMHMIGSHHGSREWGAIELPMFPEAAVLHYLDLIDSQKVVLSNAMSAIKKGTFAKPYGMDVIYHPNYSF